MITTETQQGKITVKFLLWPSIILSIVLSIIGTLVINILL